MIYYILYRLCIFVGLLIIAGVVCLITAVANHEHERPQRRVPMRVLNGLHASSQEQTPEPPPFPDDEDLDAHLTKTRRN